ncbi:MAG: hypothetical protein JNK67_10105 [Alphaproteobacteria bacterium]|nr:hypothetical protein [Alphaproteobacteria bacterium]
MIRAATLLWTALAGAVGFGLFHLKHEVQALDEELVRLNRQILAEHQTIHVLKAEWSYFNQPQRLEALAQRHLDLAPMKPQQIGRLADLPRRAAPDAAVSTVAAPPAVATTPAAPIAPTTLKPLPRPATRPAPAARPAVSPVRPAAHALTPSSGAPR